MSGRTFPVAGRVSVVTIVALFTVVLVALMLVGTLTSPLADGPPPLNITVDGRAMLVQRGSTLAELVRAQGLHADAGRLLDVEGDVLQRRADPGAILLNGVEPPHSTPLHDADTISVVDGEDQTEDTIKIVTELGEPVPPNPASVIGSAKSIEVTIQGKTSGKIAANFVKPVGKVLRPDEVALTFDDGPWPGATGKILSILKRLNAKATFFVVGFMAQRYPDLVRREVAAGMTVANHSWSHPGDPPFDDLSPTRLEAEISQVDAVLATHGVDPHLFRPPGGSWDEEVRAEAQEQGMRIVLWDVDTQDWRSSRTPKQIVQSVLSGVRPGSIVLMHDGGGDAHQTIAALPEIIKGIRKLGLKLVAL